MIRMDTCIKKKKNGSQFPKQPLQNDQKEALVTLIIQYECTQQITEKIIYLKLQGFLIDDIVKEMSIGLGFVKY